MSVDTTGEQGKEETEEEGKKEAGGEAVETAVSFTAVIPESIDEEIPEDIRSTEMPDLNLNYIASTSHEKVFISAAHSIAVIRQDEDYRGIIRDRRVHIEEKYTGLIAAKLAVYLNDKLSINPGLCIWNMCKGTDPSNLDPNYLIPSELAQSPFHHALHAFFDFNMSEEDRMTSLKTPVMMAIDIHGKDNRKGELDIDIGIESMRSLWKCDGCSEFIQRLEEFFDGIFNDPMSKFILHNPKAKKSFPVTIESDPYLSGFWGGSTYTMTTRATMLGMCGIQLEIPTVVRRELVYNDEMFEVFAQSICDLFTQVVQPHWHLIENVLSNDDCRTERWDVSRGLSYSSPLWKLKEGKSKKKSAEDSEEEESKECETSKDKTTESVFHSYDFTAEQYRHLVEILKRANWDQCAKKQLIPFL